MNNGDWVVCVRELNGFTKNKKYQLISDTNGIILEIKNDSGWIQSHVLYGVREKLDNYKYPERLFGSMTERVYYFKFVSELREDKINLILE